jgi:hypothetical protein
MHPEINGSFSTSLAGRKLPFQVLSEENGAEPKKQASRPKKAQYCETSSTYEIKSNAHVRHRTYSRKTSPNNCCYRDDSQHQEYRHQRIASHSRCEHDGIYPAYSTSSSYCAYPAGEEQEPSTPPIRSSFSRSPYYTSAVGLVTPDYTPSAANILPPDEIDWLHVANMLEAEEVPDHQASDHHTSNDRLHQQQPNDSAFLRPNDIVCGRGAPTNNHPGNQLLCKLVKDYQISYLLCAKRSEKPRIAIELLEAIRFRGGRFVRRNKTTGRSFSWVEIGEKAAYEKVCQYLRDDGAPKLRRRILAAAAAAAAGTTTGTLKLTRETVGIGGGSRYDNKEN